MARESSVTATITLTFGTTACGFTREEELTEKAQGLVEEFDEWLTEAITDFFGMKKKDLPEMMAKHLDDADCSVETEVEIA